MMVSFDGQLNEIWNHLGDRLLGMTTNDNLACLEVGISAHSAQLLELRDWTLFK